MKVFTAWKLTLSDIIKERPFETSTENRREENLIGNFTFHGEDMGELRFLKPR